MIEASIQKNDRKAYWVIGIFSVIVFTVVVALSRFKLDIQTSFDVHIFAKIDALTNAIVAVLLVVALIAVKQKKYKCIRT
jgi:putative membrane protein